MDVGARVTDPLVREHARLESLLDRAVAALGEGDERERARAWGELESELLAHMDAEERLLLPLFHRVSPRGAAIVGQEHRHIRARLAEVGASIAAGRPDRALARAFAAELRAHARSEERLLYRWAEVDLGPAERESVLVAWPLPRHG